MTGAVRLNLGVPVQRFSITVQHATPRVPNAPESALIQILLRLGNLPKYRASALVDLFSDMLCIPQSALWLAPVLQELTDIRLLTCGRDLDDIDAIVLGDLALTERGQTMVDNGKLLGRPQRIALSWCWDPVALEVRNPQQWERLQKQAPPLSLPAESYQDVFPMDAFRADLANASWYRPGETEIETVSVKAGAEVAWESISVDVASDRARLLCTTSRPAVQQYLQEQNDATLTDRLAAAIFGEAYASFDDWAQVAPSAGASFIPLPQLAERLGDAVDAAFDNTALDLFDGIWDAPAGSLRVHYAATGDAPVADRGADGEQRIVSGRALPASSGNVIVDGDGWSLCRVAVQIGRATVAAPVALAQSRGPKMADGALAQALLQSGEAGQIAAALRLDAATAWPSLLQSLRAAHRGKACLDEVLRWMAEMTRHVPNAAAAVDRHVLQKAFLQALGEHGRIDTAGDLTTWRIALQAFELPSAPAAMQQLLEAACPASSIAGLHAMTQEARLVTKNFCVPYGPATYASSLVAEYLALGSLDKVERALRNPNPFERQLLAVWKEGGALGRMLGTTFPIAAPAPQALAKILREQKVEACTNAIGQWRALLDDFYRQAQLDAPDAASPFEKSRISLQDWQDQLARAASSGAGQYDYVFVVDTNALINLPELPQKMVGNVLLVVPQVVWDELDRKKRDPALRKASNRAAQLLTELPATRRCYVESDLALLPADFEDTPDNRILSVAMKYLHSNLRLVSDDTNLIAKAASMKITAVKIERFGGGQASRTPPPRKAGKPGPHHKGQVA
jgi:rRNA-processing protein FCF1